MKINNLYIYDKVKQIFFKYLGMSYKLYMTKFLKDV